MTRTQENTLSMFTPTETVLQQNKEVWTGMAGFENAHSIFLGTWAIIDPDAQKQLKGTKPTTVDKAAERTELMRLVLLTSGNVYAYAAQHNKAGLQKEMEIFPTSLDRMRDNILLATANMVYEKANAIIDELDGYGVTSDSLNQFNTVIESFKVNAGAPRHATSTNKTATANIKENLATCIKQLEIMDKLIENFRSAQPIFVSNYFNARKIVDLGHRKTVVGPTNNLP